MPRFCSLLELLHLSCVTVVTTETVAELEALIEVEEDDALIDNDYPQELLLGSVDVFVACFCIIRKLLDSLEDAFPGVFSSAGAELYYVYLDPRNVHSCMILEPYSNILEPYSNILEHFLEHRKYPVRS